MTPAQVADTIRWIISKIPERAKERFLRSTPRDPESVLAAHEMAYASAILERNPYAVQVIKAFHLEPILNREYIADWTMKIFAEKGAEAERKHVAQVTRPWLFMNESLGPWESLTVPSELRTAPAEEVISVEIRHSAKMVPLPMVATAMEHLETAYSAVARVFLGPNRPQDKLEIISIQSGSLIRIDCRGIGEAVKQTKELLLESWRKIRHKRAEELVEKNHAALSSLGVIEAIAALEKKGCLPPEEAETLRRDIFCSVTGLYQCNAILAEVRPIEIVNNDKLLENFSPKLLGTGPREEEDESKQPGENAPSDGQNLNASEPSVPKTKARKRRPRRSAAVKERPTLPKAGEPSDADLFVE